MARLFGTDGVRGIANADLSCELALQIGAAGAYVLTSAVHNPRILVGMDTRRSAYGGHLLRWRGCAECRRDSYTGDGLSCAALRGGCRRDDQRFT